MLTRIVLSLALVGAAACADETSDRADLPDPGGPDIQNPKTDDEPVPDAVQGLVVGPNRLQCASDGPCSPACDQSMIIDIHVPEGNCVFFDCSPGPKNGTQVGGCPP